MSKMPSEKVSPPPQHLYEFKSAPLASLKMWALAPKLGEARIAALENLAERTELSWLEFAELFLAPQTWADPDEHVRWLAVRALARRAPERGVEQLIEALADSSWLVREHALFASQQAIARLGALSLSSATHPSKLKSEILPLLFYFLRSPLQEISKEVEKVLVGLLQHEPELFVTVFEQNLLRSPPRERACLLRALSRGLAFAALGQVPIVIPFFERLLSQLEAEVANPSVEVRIALVQSLQFLVEFYEQNNHAVPAPFLEIFLVLLSDPHPKVRASSALLLTAPSALQFGALALLRIQEQNAENKMSLEQMIELVLRAASRTPWNQKDLPAALRDLWYKVVLRYLGHASFRVRRAARAVLVALGPSLVSSLIELCNAELNILTYDDILFADLERQLGSAQSRTALEKRHLDFISASFLLEKTLVPAGSLGGVRCLEIIEKELAAPQPLSLKSLLEARAKILSRFFVLRSLSIVLWNMPERESEAGLPIKKALTALQKHPCGFVGHAANIGQ